MASWLDNAWHTFDFAVLEAIHRFALATNGALTPLIRWITSLGHGGLGLILLGLLLLLFRKTRKTGVTVLFALLIGAIITNLTLKPLIARARPYASGVLREWWLLINGRAESDLSFPSGHSTTAAATAVAIFLANKKGRVWPVLLFPLVMGFTRLYLVVHYPTDVLAGLLCGTVGAVIAHLALRPAFARIDKNPAHPFCRFFRTADLSDLFRRVPRPPEDGDTPS